MKKVGIALIGYNLMGRVHSRAYQDVKMFFSPPLIPVRNVICGRQEQLLRDAQEKLEWHNFEIDWKKAIKREDVDIIDICTPVCLHKDIAISAAENGKHILCEKPMAMNSNEAKEMLEAAEKNKIKHMVMFNYRRVPAIELARQIIQEGRVGEIYHFRAHYLQDWLIDKSFPIYWRLKKDQAGSGVSGDLGSHLIDLARFLVGEFNEVVGADEIFVKEREILDDIGERTGLMGKVDVDEASTFISRFDNGAIGIFEVSRVANGRKNYEYFEINGSKGSIIFNFERMNELQFFSREDPSHLQGFKNILVTEKHHPFMNKWWHSGLVVGYEEPFVHSINDFLLSIYENTIPEPNFLDGLRTHQVLDAVTKSIQERSWIMVEK